VTPAAKLTQYYTIAQEKANNDPDESMRPLYWDIVILIVPWLESTQVDAAFAEALAMARNDSALLQKKAWRVLEQIASCENQVCQAIMTENEDAIIKGFMSTLGSVAANARKPRIQLLDIMLSRLSMDSLNALISELVLCTKDKNAITRALSYTVLTKIAARYVSNGEEGAILPFMQTLLQGLTGNPLTVSCTLNVLNISLHEFRREIPSEIHEMVLDNVLLLMGSNAREILKATVSFLITLTKILDRDTLAVHVEKIVTSVVNWKKETRNPFRVKVRRLLERLIKKFGFEIVVKFVPEGSPLAKMLANAKKIRARNERKRAEQGAAEESEEEEYRDADQNLDDLINETDSEDDDDQPRAKKSKSKKFTDQLMETEDGEVVDLSAAHGAISSAQVRSKKQRKQKSNDSDDEIGSAPDGRIIVREKKNYKEDMDMLSSDDEEGLPENIRMSDQKIAMNEKSERGTKGKKREADSSLGGGEVYQSKKAKGDVKRKNKHDPYSYLPLRKDMLNKRKKHSGGAVPGLKNIVQGAKKGAQKGRKNRTRK